MGTTVTNRLLLLLLGICLVAVPGRAVADDGDYSSSIVTRTEVTAKSPIRGCHSTRARATVTSDIAAGRGSSVALSRAAAAPMGGSVRFSLDGDVIGTVPLRRNNTADVNVPKSVLTEGSHTLRATYIPKAGSDYAGSTGTTEIVVTNCDDGDSRGGVASDGDNDGDNDGILPDTGGLTFWLLVIAALLLAAGAAFVVRNRKRT